MAWKIKAGNVEGAASALSIASAPTGRCDWRVVASHPCHAAADDVWQAILANLIQQENNDEQ